MDKDSTQAMIYTWFQPELGKVYECLFGSCRGHNNPLNKRIPRLSGVCRVGIDMFSAICIA